MNKRRLLKLADMLEADAKNKNGIKFDLRTIITPSKTLTLADKEVPVSCGTQACAMGLAAISGEFKRAGLSYQMEAGWSEGVYVETTMHGETVDYDEAAERLFGISTREAEFLFSPSFYSSRLPKKGAEGERVVAKRIRDFVAGKVAPKAERA